MLYFDKSLMERAYEIIYKAKETYDDLDTMNDIQNICCILDAYKSTKQFDIQQAYQLDSLMRSKYPTISRLLGMPSASIKNNNAVLSAEPDIIASLRVDYYGILIETLLKKKIINDVKEALDKQYHHNV